MVDPQVPQCSMQIGIKLGISFVKGVCIAIALENIVAIVMKYLI